MRLEKISRAWKILSHKVMVTLISIDNPEMIAWRIKPKERGINSLLILFFEKYKLIYLIYDIE